MAASASSIGSRKRKVLTLEDRMKVVQRNEKGESCIAIAKSLGVGKTQIQYIVRDKEAIKARWEAGENRSRKTTKLRQSTHVSIDEQVWDWFVDARRRNIPVTGKLIQEKALLISMKEQLEDFQASDGWLRRWKDRHNVHLSCLSGERADVSEETVVSMIVFPLICHFSIFSFSISLQYMYFGTVFFCVFASLCVC